MVQIDGVNVLAEFKSGSRFIIRDVSFTIEQGESIAIAGESGCGKTMLAQALLGILPGNCSASGKALLDGIDILHTNLCGDKIILMPQSGYEALNPLLKVKTHMFEALKKLKKRQKIERAAELLRISGIEDPERVMELYPFALSGGMAQKVVFAMGLASKPSIVIADEPTRGIDEMGEAAYFETLKQNFYEASTVIITHSLNIAKKCDYILVMNSGIVMEYGKSNIIFKYLKHPYTKVLYDALPENEFHLKKTNIIGDSENRGCPCLKICPKADCICNIKLPPLEKRDDGVYRRCFNA